MVANIYGSPRRGSGGFQRVADVFLACKGLPFAEILSAERIERVFAQHGCRFGLYGIYTVAITVWSFLSQVLRDGKEATCQAAVARVVSHCQQLGITAPTSDTGDYCRARAKLVESAIRTLSCEVAAGLELAANKAWLWKNRFHAKLIDGFTFTMPATSKNQARYPQSTAQKPGVGLPIARVVGILSLATACVMNLALGPYQGKETGEPALLRMLLRSFVPGDIAVADRYYCSFMMIALLLRQGVQTCARKHQLRHSDFRRGRRLGKYDHLITWTRPQRPEWMDEVTYAQIPETLTLREIRYNIVVSGRRTRTIDLITTLLNADEFTQQDIADLYGFRWNAELDIRSIKASLNLAHVRCKSPEMVHRELWTTILAYNLIRTTAAGAALVHDKQPRQISFTRTCQYVLASWMQLSGGSIPDAQLDEYLTEVIAQIADCRVAHRPERLEPRVLRRRRHGYPLMQKPRAVLRAELRRHCT